VLAGRNTHTLSLGGITQQRIFCNGVRIDKPGLIFNKAAKFVRQFPVPYPSMYTHKTYPAPIRIAGSGNMTLLC
jgi:hypothetical protein